MIVSHQAFMWFVTAAAVGICIGWGARDVYLLVKNLSPRGRQAWADQGAWRDQIFGSVVGLTIIALGLYGVVRYWSRH